MDLQGNGIRVSVEAASQSDEWLIASAQEIHEAAEARGLKLPFATGVVAVEGAMQDEAELDTPVEAVPVTKESLQQQLRSTHQGYRDTVDALNNGRRKNSRIEAVLLGVVAAEFDGWLTDEKLAQVAAIQEADPNVQFTLVATPNVLANPKDVIKAAKAFGKNQPYETYVWDDLYNKYSGSELSGTNPENGHAVNFSLIPSTFNPELEGTIEQLRAKFAELQAQNPDLKMPSVLDAVTYWSTLRAQGEQLADGTTFDRTYIRHFGLPEQRVGDWLDVPDSYVYDDGEPVLDSSIADGRNVARVSVG